MINIFYKLKNFFLRLLQILTFLLDKKKYFCKVRSQTQNQEKEFIDKFLKKFENKNFLEIGFHWFQFNCIGLIDKNFEGFLIDGGSKKNIILMKLFCFVHKFKVKVHNLFVNKKNINSLIPKKLGVLSIDIDGNDYWILNEILNTKPNIEMIVVEYNASFLDKCITIPYDENFNRHIKHESGMYHGASLKAFIKLLNNYDFCLINTIGGINAFFLKKKLLTKFEVKEISFDVGYKENYLRNEWSNTTAKDQFKKISDLDYIYL